MRTKASHAIAVTHLEGRNWRRVTLTDIAAPDSGISAIALADGRVLLVHNVFEPELTAEQERTVMAVSLSYDAGNSYERVATLEDGRKEKFSRRDECFRPNKPRSDWPEYSYPSVIQSLYDGLVHITYTFSYYGSGGRCTGRENIKHIILDPCRLGDISRAPQPCSSFPSMAKKDPSQC